MLGQCFKNQIGDSRSGTDQAKTFGTAKFDIMLPVRTATGSEKLKVSLTYYYCQTKESGVCKVGSVVWTVPLELKADAKDAAVSLPYKIEEAKPAEDRS